MENEKVHGNSKKSKKKQHLYEIDDKSIENENKIYKYGISASKLNKNGSSKRANAQVNKLNKDSGWKRFFAFVLKKNIEGRAKALELEREITEKYQNNNKDAMPPGQKRPRKKTEN